MSTAVHALAALALAVSAAAADKKVEDAVAKALSQLAKGRTDEAEKTMEKLVLQMPTAEAHSARARIQLKAGNVDAVEALVPFTTALLAAGNVSLGDPMLAVGDEVLFPFWIAEGNWARQNREVIGKWIAALTEAKAFMDQNDAETRSILAKYSRLPAPVVAKVPFLTYRFTIKPEELSVWADVLHELGQLPRPVDKTKLVVTAQ